MPVTVMIDGAGDDDYDEYGDNCDYEDGDDGDEENCYQ